MENWVCKPDRPSEEKALQAVFWQPPARKGLQNPSPKPNGPARDRARRAIAEMVPSSRLVDGCAFQDLRIGSMPLIRPEISPLTAAVWCTSTLYKLRRSKLRYELRSSPQNSDSLNRAAWKLPVTQYPLVLVGRGCEQTTASRSSPGAGRRRISARVPRWESAMKTLMKTHLSRFLYQELLGLALDSGGSLIQGLHRLQVSTM